jgi:hypothetical protein
MDTTYTEMASGGGVGRERSLPPQALHIRVAEIDFRNPYWSLTVSNIGELQNTVEKTLESNLGSYWDMADHSGLRSGMFSSKWVIEFTAPEELGVSSDAHRSLRASQFKYIDKCGTNVCRGKTSEGFRLCAKDLDEDQCIITIRNEAGKLFGLLCFVCADPTYTVIYLCSDAGSFMGMGTFLMALFSKCALTNTKEEWIDLIIWKPTDNAKFFYKKLGFKSTPFVRGSPEYYKKSVNTTTGDSFDRSDDEDSSSDVGTTMKRRRRAAQFSMLVA